MTTTTTATDRSTPEARPRWHRVTISAIAGCLTATIAIEVYGAIGRAAGVPMEAGAPGAHSAQHLTAATFAMAVFVCTLLGTVLALLCARFSRLPARAFLVTTIVLTAVSLVSPLGAAHTATATKLFLACGHLIAAAIVIPVLARQLPKSHPPRSN